MITRAQIRAAAAAPESESSGDVTAALGHVLDLERRIESVAIDYEQACDQRHEMAKLLDRALDLLAEYRSGAYTVTFYDSLRSRVCDLLDSIKKTENT